MTRGTLCWPPSFPCAFIQAANVPPATGCTLGDAMPNPPALEVLSQTFGLTSFERNIVLLCAGVELDGNLARRCAAAHGQNERVAPTFSLAMTVFPDAHWSALAPTGPLRRWQLIDVNASQSLTGGALRVDERVEGSANSRIGHERVDLGREGGFRAAVA